MIITEAVRFETPEWTPSLIEIEHQLGAEVTDRRSVRINYLLEDTALFGGVKVVLHHAELLRRIGHRVTVVSRGQRPTWYPTGDDFRTVPEFSAEYVPEADLQVATFWTTVAAAAALPSGQAVHFCQGFEGGLEHNRDDHPQIIETYSRVVPTWVVSPHLAELNRDRFNRPVRIVPPALESYWRPRRRLGPGRRPRVLVLHPFEFYMKGVDTALEAVRLLRERGVDLRLVRLSQWPLGEAERAIAEPDEFHHHHRPARGGGAARRLRSSARAVVGVRGLRTCRPRGHGLWSSGGRVADPVARELRRRGGGAGAGKDAEAFAAAADESSLEWRRWRAIRGVGLECAQRFPEDTVAASLDEAVRWVASGRWITGE